MAARPKTEKKMTSQGTALGRNLFKIIQFTSPQFQASLLDLWDDIGVFWAGRRTLCLLPSHMITSNITLDDH